MRNYKTIVSFVAGAGVMVLLFFGLKSCLNLGNKTEKSDYYILTNQISKMNKMVVMEQNTSSMQKTKMGYEVFGKEISSNSIITYTKTNAQVSYDLNKMKIEVDSINKKLVITELPDADIRITPSVEIQSLDDSFINRISEKDIKNVTEKAKETALKSIDQNQLRSEGRKQLMENLDNIFVLAKALNYTIEDKTGKIGILGL
ncbi:DUF4230 domain-containing protein [Chryseobacterium arthrosphaerae]|uniref:DUF4230 domain-containing protein n=1 Tax=Chryseobacterium arthrosphaerae TaxID=651561 RepID=A0A1B8ZQD4_9FLAO|nr:DUF4230 domain-containing protein [Chryseobacterium arthrosphaerae]MDG4652597.1 DUF4230 domain-containing protein [Chryseobacterium arthrosphaerae]OCA73789.1 hypothetical protein BBI00_05280 [Chryseobacterium arthrosphaerae]QUY57393.1 DUF4230 domain-containing protein [Chryseobacterium arthrosphaerae]RTZ46668.1 DUF4230 domain-containing protein [Chryseobacterium arthrosphaerae]UEQ77268.1 DUF4230 domain-containing protein [Chryseobacterium arthrosphaerae]